MTKEIALQKASELAADTNIFASFLEQFGLPTDNIIATTEERNVVSTNLPNFLNTLSPEEKRDARYLSKFVGATAIGLFDAALNYVWNEVVLNLRKKASVYGIDLFFDAAVGGRNRDLYNTEEDLPGLKDTVLLDTCRKLELLSDVVYRKIDHILTMRNEVAASHPNVESIGGFELLGWLQTCVKDVLQDRPSDSAIKIKALVDNLKARTDIIDEHTQRRFPEELKHLSIPHVHNLLISIFGMYVSPRTEQVLRKNIALIAKAVWDHAVDNLKYNIGIKIDGYRTNLQQFKQEKGVEFLTIVGGRRYETLSSRLIALDTLAERLLSAHHGWDNFYNEPPVMREILEYCHELKDIPNEVLPKIIKIVIKCRLGRGLSYCQGVSPAGRQLYDKFLSLLDDNGIANALIALFSSDINSKLQNKICQDHLDSILNTLKQTAVSERLSNGIDYLLQDIANAYKANRKKEFRDITSPFIRWN
ncbi:hypothetical protein KAT92_02460 [Candidatus Babeliales bacterium]|nr:hypothetical protein [Candidatus Babeliales bacterium]